MVCRYRGDIVLGEWGANLRNYRLSSINLPWTPLAKSSPEKVSDLSSRVLARTSSVVLRELVCSPSTIRFSSCCSVKPSRVALAEGR